MKIGVISDTHGNVAAFKKALEYFDGADLIVHAGDILYHPPRLAIQEDYNLPEMVEVINNCPVKIKAVQGNCDAEVYKELLNISTDKHSLDIEVKGIKLFVTHGHGISENELEEKARMHNSDFVISGHTHIPILERKKKYIRMNPGSPSIPKYEENGVLIPSVGIITDSKASIVDINTGREIMFVDI